MTATADPEEPALPVGAAAQRLGVSTLRIRQFVAEGRLDAIRDNRGRLRVRIGPDGPRPPSGNASASAAELLMDELIELREDDAERAAQAERLGALVGELSGLLDRTLDALEHARGEAAAERARAAALGERMARALDLAERALAAAGRRGQD